MFNSHNPFDHKKIGKTTHPKKRNQNDFHKLISIQLAETLESKSKKFDQIKTDMIGLMLLEAAHCLQFLKDFPLKLKYKFIQSYSGCNRFPEQRSLVEFGCEYEKSPEQENKSFIIEKNGLGQKRYTLKTNLAEIFLVNIIENFKKIDCAPDWNRHMFDNVFNTDVSFTLPSSYLEYFIKSSSLYKAAGNLSKLSLQDLEALKEKINDYVLTRSDKIANNEIIKIIDFYSNKISDVIKLKVSEEEISVPIVQQSIFASPLLLSYPNRNKNINHELQQIIEDHYARNRALMNEVQVQTIMHNAQKALEEKLVTLAQLKKTKLCYLKVFLTPFGSIGLKKDLFTLEDLKYISNDFWIIFMTEKGIHFLESLKDKISLVDLYCNYEGDLNNIVEEFKSLIENHHVEKILSASSSLKK